MRVVICDMDTGCCSKIEEWLVSYQQETKVKLEVDIYNNAERLIQHIKEDYSFDLIFLDIELPEMNGIELGRIIRDTFPDRYISMVYMSKKTKYCSELFALEPLNFHKKPLKKDQIIGDVSKVVSRMRIKKTVVSCVIEGKKENIAPRQVMYIEANGNMLELTLKDRKKAFMRESLAKFEDEYGGDFLFRCHKSFLVNYDYVKYYEIRYFVLEGGIHIPIGRKFSNDMKLNWMEYIIER
ncbi:MAG: response regulator transcription factor [Lachnospiraceae bacterium]|nr:response regulator transcription factor [Lachnospiraceae bacterium]